MDLLHSSEVHQTGQKGYYDVCVHELLLYLSIGRCRAVLFLQEKVFCYFISCFTGIIEKSRILIHYFHEEGFDVS